MLYGAATFIPAMGVTTRRLHDTGKRGWWILLALIPVVGAIALLILLAQNSDRDGNSYGPNPKNDFAFA
jgi:uncharacterized membrane protein YhaH (DUF805 family)